MSNIRSNSINTQADEEVKEISFSKSNFTIAEKNDNTDVSNWGEAGDESSRRGFTFSFFDFVQLRKHQGLTKISTDLHELSNTLEQELRSQIDANFEKFLGYAFQLDGTELKFKEILESTDTTYFKIKDLLKAISKEKALLDKHLAIQTEIRDKRSLLQTMSRAISMISKLENLVDVSVLPESDASRATNWFKTESFLRSEPKYAERVAVEYSQLLLMLNQGHDLVIIETLKPRAEEIGRCILRQVEINYTRCLDGVILTKSGQEEDLVALAQCFRAYALLGYPNVAEAQFEARVVTPAIDQIIRAVTGNLQHSRTITTLNLLDIYEPLLAFLTDRCAPILDICYYRLKQLNFDLLANAVFPAVSSALIALSTKQCPVFASADPEAFYQNYVKTTDFLLKFEGLFPDLSSVIGFRSTSSYKEFIKKWPTNVYFRLRFKTLVADLHYPDSILEASKASPPFNFKTSQETINSIKKSWQCGVYLPTLAHRFWKLTLQLVSRYENWINQLIDNSSSSTDWELWLSLWFDLQRFSSHFNEYFETKISVTLRELSSTLLVQEAIENCNDILGKSSIKLSHSIIDGLDTAMMSFLEGIRTIPSSYRHTNQPLPQIPSTYIKGAFAQLDLFKSKIPLDSTTEKNTLSDWVDTSLIHVSNRFGEIIQELLLTLKRTEDSLSQLKRATSKTSNRIAQSVTDEVKIRHQILLDVKEFGTQAHNFTDHPRVKAALFSLYATVNDLAKEYDIALD